jgi:hypothetical protein
LCLQANLCHSLKMMMMKDHEQMSKTPRTVLGDRWQRGREVSIESLVLCSTSTLSEQIWWNRFLDLGGTSFNVSQPQYLFCQANSVAPSFKNRWHWFWLLYATGPCNKFLLASVGLENLCCVC